jgi:hypothetical protein
MQKRWILNRSRQSDTISCAFDCVCQVGIWMALYYAMATRCWGMVAWFSIGLIVSIIKIVDLAFGILAPALYDDLDR